MPKPTLEMSAPFEIESPASPSYMLAASVMGSPLGPPPHMRGFEPYGQELLPSQFISNTLEAWERRQLPDDLPTSNTSRSIFTPKEAHMLDCLSWSYAPHDSKLRQRAMNLAGLAAMPRILAADYYLQQKKQLISSLQEQGFSPDDEHTFVGGLAVTPAELIKDLPWNMQVAPDLFSFSERQIGECARLFMGHAATCSTVYEAMNKGSETVHTNFQPPILRSELFRSLVRNSLRNDLDGEVITAGASTPITKPRQEVASKSLAIDNKERVELQLPAATNTLLADMVESGEGQWPILRGAAFDRDQASALVHAHIQLCGSHLLASNSQSFRTTLAPVLGGKEQEGTYFEDLPADATVLDTHMVLEPFMESHESQFPKRVSVKQAFVLSYLSRVRMADGRAAQHHAKSYVLYIGQQGRGPARLQVRQSITRLSQKIIYERFSEFIAAQSGAS